MHAKAEDRHLTCTLVELGCAQRAVGELERLLEVPLRAVVRAKGGRPFACTDEHALGVRPQLERIGCVGVELERRQQVRGDDLHELVVALLPLLLEIRGGRNVPRLALLPRQCLVGDLAQEILEEAVLPTLGRAGISLKREDLLPHERH